MTKVVVDTKMMNMNQDVKEKELPLLRPALSLKRFQEQFDGCHISSEHDPGENWLRSTLQASLRPVISLNRFKEAFEGNRVAPEQDPGEDWLRATLEAISSDRGSQPSSPKPNLETGQIPHSEIMDVLDQSAQEANAPANRRKLEMKMGKTLTHLQARVLRMLAEGRTDEDIARRLKISTRMVKSHKGQVMKQLLLPKTGTVRKIPVGSGIDTLLKLTAADDLSISQTSITRLQLLRYLLERN